MQIQFRPVEPSDKTWVMRKLSIFAVCSTGIQVLGDGSDRTTIEDGCGVVKVRVRICLCSPGICVEYGWLSVGKYDYWVGHDLALVKGVVWRGLRSVEKQFTLHS